MLDMYPEDDDRSWIRRLTELLLGADPGGLWAKVTGGYLETESTVETGGTESTFTDYSGNAQTVEIGGDVYLDVRPLAYLRARAKAGSATDASISFYERLTRGDDDKEKITDKTFDNSGFSDLVSKSVEGISYVRFESDQDAAIVVAGGA